MGQTYYLFVMLRIDQWLAGRDFATGDPAAAQMINFVYRIADDATRRAVLVDPAWDVDGLIARVEREGYALAGVLATHYHPDHVGGDLWGLQVEGLTRVLELRPATPVHAHADELHGLRVVTGLPEREVSAHRGGDAIELGSVRIELVHTPGHTPGSQCFLVTDPTAPAGTPGHPESPALVSGDTLFVQGCGRVDLPGSDPDEMYRTLTQRLAKLPETTVLLPGHDYGPTPTSTLADERRSNPYVRVPSLEAWRALMS
ncbi:MAG: MBL fold metallo-hydrolase [Candidatus Eiseniibacteriota bacterium]